MKKRGNKAALELERQKKVDELSKKTFENFDKITIPPPPQRNDSVKRSHSNSSGLCVTPKRSNVRILQSPGQNLVSSSHKQVPGEWTQSTNIETITSPLTTPRNSSSGILNDAGEAPFLTEAVFMAYSEFQINFISHATKLYGCQSMSELFKSDQSKHNYMDMLNLDCTNCWLCISVERVLYNLTTIKNDMRALKSDGNLRASDLPTDLILAPEFMEKWKLSKMDTFVQQEAALGDRNVYAQMVS